MRVDHRGADIAVAQQFLQRADIRPTFQQLRGKGMPQRVRRDLFRDPRPPHCHAQCLPDPVVMQMMPPPPGPLGKESAPAPDAPVMAPAASPAT